MFKNKTNSNKGDDMKRKINMIWTCSDYVHHQHRWRWVAILCGKIQKLMRFPIDWHMKQHEYINIEIRSRENIIDDLRDKLNKARFNNEQITEKIKKLELQLEIETMNKSLEGR